MSQRESIPSATPFPARPHGVPASPPLSRRLDPTERLFREQAVVAYRDGAETSAIVRLVRPGAWLVLVCLGSLVLSAAAVFGFGHLELSATARGALHGSVRPTLLVSEIPGVVKAIRARDGDVVAEG